MTVPLSSSVLETLMQKEAKNGDIETTMQGLCFLQDIWSKDYAVSCMPSFLSNKKY